ncbi:uncharacterized protein YutD [Scopulibacillus darangshiensis]|uniref:Uncharacterized protein YutD n=1 Tax=Scopulibacillus darangshiensis TaxID=442528 RepID=A0A4R2NDJ4_9BACL|nr:YutD family protein [Scopulibacillus darangshiensis]TCP19135.1 uncharacterized protein YutD [Scopulibacillus darangshiensis]
MGNDKITINNQTYELIEDVREGWNEDAFQERYSDILNKYDFVVGDWGYDQLRLRGFYDDQNRKSTFDTKISALTDYIYEYCNFGCAYFVLQKIKEAKEQA